MLSQPPPTSIAPSSSTALSRPTVLKSSLSPTQVPLSYLSCSLAENSSVDPHYTTRDYDLKKLHSCETQPRTQRQI